MKNFVVELREDAHEVRVEGQVFARLAGGSLALLRGAGEPLRDIGIEHAIELAEDWLMPFVASLRGRELQLLDTKGALRDWLGAPATFTPEAVEQAFTRAFDAVAFQRPIDRELVADLVLLRELVHHAAVTQIVVG